MGLLDSHKEPTPESHNKGLLGDYENSIKTRDIIKHVKKYGCTVTEGSKHTRISGPGGTVGISRGSRGHNRAHVNKLCKELGIPPIGG